MSDDDIRFNFRNRRGGYAKRAESVGRYWKIVFVCKGRNSYKTVRKSWWSDSSYKKLYVSGLLYNKGAGLF